MNTEVQEKIRQALERFREQHPVQTMKIDGAWWEYLLTGEGEETLVFLHGMLGSVDVWWQQILALEGTYRILAVTYPAVPTLEGLTEGVWRLMAYYGIEKAAVIGSSMGGYLAQYMLSRYSEKWTHVVLGNTFPPNDHIARETRWQRRLLPLLPEWLIKRQMRRHIEEVIYPSSGYSETVRWVLLEQLQRMRKEDLLARYRCIIEPFSPPQLGEQAPPVLIIESDNDPLIPPSLRNLLKSTYPTAGVYTFHEAGHFPYLSHSDEYTRVLQRFLAGEI